MHAAEPLPHFVDDYLSFLYEVHPTGATMDGVHVHDDLIEDYRRSAIDTHVSALAGFAPPARRHSRRHACRRSSRSSIRSSSSNIRARQFELEAVRSWERNPHVYADTLASSLAAQAIFTYAPETERARRVLSKLRQVPRLVQAARDNIKEPPAIFVKVGIDTWRGAMAFIDADLPRAFSNVDDMHLLGDLADACDEAVQTIGAYVERSRDRDPAEGEGHVPARTRSLRAEAAPRRRHHAAGRSAAGDRHARARRPRRKNSASSPAA